MLRWSCALAVALGAAAPATARDLQNFKPAPGTWNYLTVEGAGTAGSGELVPSLYVNYGHNPLVRRDANGDVTSSIVAHLVTTNFLLVYGIIEDLELGLDLPFGYADGDEIDTLGDGSGVGLGDIRLLPKYRLLGHRDSHFGLAISVPISLPSGDAERGMGADTVLVNPRLIGEVKGYGLAFAANVGYRWRKDDFVLENVQVGNEVTYGAGASVELGSPDWLLLAEVYGAAPAESLENDSASKPLEALLAGRLFTDWGGVFTLGGGYGVIGDYGSPDLRILGGFAWHPRPDESDRDGDGIPDSADACPDEPEDKDGFEDANGCPDPDNDQDGIPDTEDQCPNEPETVNGVDDEDGCPDVGDRDGDGIPDTADACPDQPEDKDGFEDEDGCPDPDNDKDGIPDVDDKCPLEPEVINGVDDDDGCPDVGVTKVKLTREKIEILDKVYFETNSAEIRSESFDVLNQVASVLRANPQIAQLRIEGHTDSRGSEAINLPLSKDRARSVRQYLVGRGIDPARLASEGYGSSRPVVPGNDEAAWSQNRRVEFVIVEEAEPAGE